MSEDEILIKLIRDYSHKEKFDFIIRKYREKSYLVGQLQSEIEHLKHELETIRIGYLSKNKQTEYRSVLEANKNLLDENRILKQKLKI